MLVSIVWFCFGLILLLIGADRFLKGASAVALRFGISPFVVGLTLVGFGTSAPELAVNLLAALRGSFELALGNVVGSNIANVGLIMGVSALVAPLTVQMRLLRVEAPLLVGVSLALWLLCLDQVLGRADAALLLIGFVALMAFIARDARREPSDVQQELAEYAQARPRLRGMRVGRRDGGVLLALFVSFTAWQMLGGAQ